MRQKRAFTRQHLIFLIVAVLFMIAIDRVLPGPGTTAPETPPIPAETVTIARDPQPVPAVPEMPDFAPPRALVTDAPLLLPEEETAMPAWRKYAVPSPPVPEGHARVVVIIDDMGMDRGNTRETSELPGPLTFAFLPYAGELQSQTAYARLKGHELMVHMPMAPVNPQLDAGPDVLKPDSDPAVFDATIERGLSAFSGYVGVNNHMGSLMTQDRDGMRRVMAALKARGLLFVDSKTISTSVAEAEAVTAGVPHAGRDVFLDHEETLVAVNGALDHLEREALKNGLAIAIGHPKDNTIAALRAWLPTLAGKGITLVPVSAVVKVP